MDKSKWEYKKLGEVCQIFDKLRKPITKRNRISGAYPYYGATGIQDYVNDYIFEGRYLLIGEDGAKWGSHDQSAYIIEGRSWVNNHAHIIKLNDEYYDSFLKYYLNYKNLQPYITGAIVPKLTQAALLSIPIPSVDISTQHQIVSEFDQLSDIISLKQQQIKEYDALAQSLFYEMFGDPLDTKDEQLNRTLGEICSITSSKRIFANEYVSQGIPFFRGKEITELSKGESVSEPLYISEKRYNEIKSKYGIPQTGDILLTAVGTIGNLWIVNNEKPFYFKDGNIIWLHPKEKLNSVFLRRLLTIIIDKFKDSLSNGAAYKALTIQNLCKVKVELPSFPLQQSFASKVQAIEHQKSLLKRSIAETQTLLDSRMQEYFG